MTAGKVQIHIDPPSPCRFDDENKAYAARVVQILDAHNDATDQIAREKNIAVCVGILGAFVVIASLVGV